MAKVKVTFENITVTNNGEGSGKGELYWLFQVDGETVNQRTVSNALKVADGDTISLGTSRQVSKSTGQTLSVYGSVSEKDDLSKDETHFFSDSYKSTENWGAKEGAYTRRINDRKLDVTVSYRVELI